MTYARVTVFDINTAKSGVAQAVQFFEDEILPAVRARHGYEGVWLMGNRDGRGLLISLWETEAAAEKGVASGFYDEQASRFLTFYRQPPERAHYELLLRDGDALAGRGGRPGER